MPLSHSPRVSAANNGGKPSKPVAALDLKVKLMLRLKLLVLFCFGVFSNLPLLCQSVLLPPPTSVYSAVVTGGFGSLNFSYHYFEYGNTTSGASHFLGRYFAPDVQEWTEPSTAGYFLKWTLCQSFPLPEVQSTRLVRSAASFLVDLNTDGLQFTNLGDSAVIRMQPAVHFTTQLSYTSSNNGGAAQSVDEFLQQAFVTAGVDNSSPYSVSVTIDVYYSGSSSALPMVGDGYIPLHFAISGARTDAHGVRQLDIQFDFMMWAQLTELQAENFLTPPPADLCYYYSEGKGTLPPLPQRTQLGAVNRTLPLSSWSSGRATLEVTTSINGALLPAQQLDALLQPANGKLINVVLADPTDSTFASRLYIYQGSNGFQFSTGTLYTMAGNIIQQDVVDTPQLLQAAAVSPCQTAAIDATNASPVQSQNGGLLMTLFAKPGFTSGVQYIGRQSIRGFVADTWSLNSTTVFNGTTYTFTLMLSATASSWNNMGRGDSQAGRQLLRLAFTGVSTPAAAAGSPAHYTVDMDFFIQYLMNWDPTTKVFDPQTLCH